MLQVYYTRRVIKVSRVLLHTARLPYTFPLDAQDTRAQAEGWGFFMVPMSREEIQHRVVHSVVHRPHSHHPVKNADFLTSTRQTDRTGLSDGS